MKPDLYALLARLVVAPATGYLLWRTLRERRGARYFHQRLGRSLPAGPFDFWVHCVSVGEVWAALSLIQALADRYPRGRILVSTCTPSGAETAAARLPANATHAYLPVDFHGSVRRFFRRVQPRCGLVVETELWPNLFRACRQRGIPLFIINGRLSERTLRAPAWLRASLRSALAAVDGCLARSAEDGRRFERLGLAPDRVQVLGNLKFARSAEIAGEVAAAPPISRPYVLAGSTHSGEEAALGALWSRLPSDGRLLVIAPRHPRRRDRILQEIRSSGLNITVRSRGEGVTEETDIYLADTLGELSWFVGHAELVFLGGSLVPVGGHNLLEPAALGKPVIVGPHTDKFHSETEGLRDAGGAVQVDGTDDLETALRYLLEDPERRRQMGAAGLRFVRGHEQVLERYLEALGDRCPEVFGREPAGWTQAPVDTGERTLPIPVPNRSLRH